MKTQKKLKEYKTIIPDFRKITLHEFRQMFTTLDIDYRIQSPERWSEGEAKDFISSVMIGRNISKFLFADLPSCFATISEDDTYNYNYYKEFYDRGVEHLNLEGNNRVQSIVRFFNNEFKLPAQIFTDENGHRWEIMEDTLWKDLPGNLKLLIDSRPIFLDVIYGATPKDMSQFFISLNSSKPLNSDEKRNSIICYANDVIRDMAKEVRGDKFYKNFLTSHHRERRGIECIVTHFLHLFIYGPPLVGSQGDMFSCCMEGIYDKHIDAFKGDFDAFNSHLILSKDELLKLRDDCFNKEGEGLGIIFDLYMIYRQQIINKEITDINEFDVEYWMDSINYLLNWDRKIKYKKATDKTFKDMNRSIFDKGFAVNRIGALYGYKKDHDLLHYIYNRPDLTLDDLKERMRVKVEPAFDIVTPEVEEDVEEHEVYSIGG